MADCGTATDEAVALGERERSAELYGDAGGYESYMGPWSTALAPLFLRYAAVGQPTTLLDVGSGTGNLLAAATEIVPDARLVGVDPSTALLHRARHRPDLRGATFVKARADALPFADGAFACCLSLLVLQEFAGRPEPISEMRRVTRASGVVAACLWDFARMPVIAALVGVLAEIDPVAGVRLAISSPSGEAALARAWAGAGFTEVSTSRITVMRTYENFDALWRSLLCGSTPSTMTLAALPARQRDRAYVAMRHRFADPRGSVPIAAEALVVRGKA
ncbi:MAG: methyltransferase domain-containing protein [Bauldia litoralis]